MPDINLKTTVKAPPEAVYAALTTNEGLAGNWTDQVDVPQETGATGRLGFGPDWSQTLELRIDALDPGRHVAWTPVAGFTGWIGTSIRWELEPTDGGEATVVNFTHADWPQAAATDEMARCGYTWALIIDRLTAQVTRGEHAPYFTAGASLPY